MSNVILSHMIYNLAHWSISEWAHTQQNSSLRWQEWLYHEKNDKLCLINTVIFSHYKFMYAFLTTQRTHNSGQTLKNRETQFTKPINITSCVPTCLLCHNTTLRLYGTLKFLGSMQTWRIIWRGLLKKK